MPSLRFLAAGLWLALAPPSAAATVFELPAEWPLGADSQLHFELANAELRFTGRADGLPVLSARVAEAATGAGLEIDSGGGTLTVRRAGGESAPAPRLRLDVFLGPGSTVRIAGRELAIRVDGDLPADAGRPVFVLLLEASEAELSGVRTPRIESAGGTVRLAGGDGPLDLTLDGGSAEVRDHRGDLELVARGADVLVADQEGRLDVDLDGGRLDVVGGAGPCGGAARGADLLFDDRGGPAELEARDGTLEARAAGVERSQWTVTGEGLDVVMGEIRGAVAVELVGGRFEGSGLRGDLRATLTGAGARCELRQVAGSLELALTGGAGGWIRDLSGDLRAELTDAVLDASGVGRLALTGTRAVVSVLGVERLQHLELAASDLTLDLRGVQGAPALTLSRAGRGRVQLTAPCVVQLADTEGWAEAAVAVSGCELRSPDQRQTLRQDRLKYGDAPDRLTVTVSRDSVLEVHGEN